MGEGGSSKCVRTTNDDKEVERGQRTGRSSVGRWQRMVQVSAPSPCPPREGRSRINSNPPHFFSPSSPVRSSSSGVSGIPPFCVNVGTRPHPRGCVVVVYNSLPPSSFASESAYGVCCRASIGRRRRRRPSIGWT